MEFSDLTPEQKEKARACETTDDLVALAQSEGVELTDEQVEAISAGAWYVCTDRNGTICPKYSPL